MPAGRPKKTDRSATAETGLSIRLTREERRVLGVLAQRRQEQLGHDAIVTLGSYIRGLIREKAVSEGIEMKTSKPR